MKPEAVLMAADRDFRREVCEFLARELAPWTAAIEDERDWGAVKRVVHALGQAGYLRLTVRELYRGELAEPGLVHATILSEEAAYLSYAFETTIASVLSCAQPIYRHAEPAVRERCLPGLLDGTRIGAICVTEPEVGSDTANMKTRIRFDPAKAEWVIDGFKRYVSNASVADVYVVYGITNPDVAAQKGMSAIVVPAGTEGMSFPRTYTFMGRRGSLVGEVELRDCRVPADHLLGRREEGFRIMVGMFNFERIMLGGCGLGVARSAFDIARAHAQRRVAFGQKLGCKQLIWDKIAEMSWRIEAAELLTYRAARMYDAGVGASELMKPAAMAKLVATESANYCADVAVQVLGGDGLTKEYGRAEQIYRDARALTVVGGTSEMAKYVIASRDLPEIKPNL